jgi:transcriptional regulator with XRE-family HTH domain
MNNIVCIFGNKFEYDFLSGWIKYNRIEAGISQEALAHGICSTSHLSYFENGKKKLRGELIEALLKKLKITAIIGVSDIGLIRQKLHKLMFQVEGFEYEAAEVTFTELLSLEPLLRTSPYNIEFNIYKPMYNIFVERKGYKELENSIDKLDRICANLDKEIIYIKGYLVKPNIKIAKLAYDMVHLNGYNADHMLIV